MADDDIVVKIKTELEGADEVEAKLKSIADSAPKEDIKFKVTAEGADQAVDQTKKVDDAVKDLDGKTATATVKVDGTEKAIVEAEALKAKVDGLGGATFAQATQSISRLGTTAEQAFTTAGAAAQKFGASANELRAVESTIAAIAGRARDSSVDFAVLASRFDAARGAATEFGSAAGPALAGVGAAAGQAGAAVAQSVGMFSGLRAALSSVSASITDFTSNLSIGRAEMRAFTAAGHLIGVPFPGFIGALVKIGNVLGTGGVITIGLAALGSAMIKLGTDALDAQKNIQQMADGTGRSFQSMAAGEAAFERLGVSAKKFGDVYKKVVDDIVLNSGKLSNSIADSADKTAAALDRVAEARMKAAETQAGAAGGPDAEAAVRSANQQQRAVLAAAAAQRELGAAIREAMTQGLNDIGPLVEKVKQLGQGFKDVRFDGGTQIASIIEAVQVRIGQVIQDGGRWEQELAKIIAFAPKLQAIKIGEAFGIPPEAVARLQKYRDNLADLFAEMEKIQEGRLEPDLTGISAMKSAFDGLKNAWNDLMSAIGESNVGGLLAASLGGVLVIITAIVKGLEAFVRFIDMVITGLRIVAGILVAGVGQTFFGMSAEDAKKLQDAIAGVNSEASKIKGDAGDRMSGSLRGAGTDADALKQKIAGLGKGVPGLQLTADQIRQLFKDGNIGLDEFNRRMQALDKIRPPSFEELKKQLADGTINLDTFNRKLADLEKIRPPSFDQLKQQLKDGTISVDEFNRKLAELEKGKPAADPFKDTKKGAEDAKKSADDYQKTLDALKGPAIKWDTTVSGADKAKDDVKKKWEDLKELKGPEIKWDTTVSAAQKAAEDVKKPFENIQPGTPTIKWEGLVRDAERAAKDVEKAFKDINLGELKGFSFDPIIQAGQAAVQAIEQAFQGINIAGVTLDFSGVISAGATAAETIATSIQTAVSSVNFSAFTTAAQAAFTALTTAAQTAFSALTTAASNAATGIGSAIDGISFSGLITKIGEVISAFGRMETAANRAAQAAASAAASSGGGFALGGLFRGRPGRDTNLAWLTDYEFIMRPEAVLKYGVDFMRMINALAFPAGGFRDGGLNRVMHTISGGVSAFRDGGLVMPRIAVPAFAAGGLNAGGGGRQAGSRSSSARPLNLTIKGETFRGLTVPEDTAKALERAAIGRQTSATGTRPRWNK